MLRPVRVPDLPQPSQQDFYPQAANGGNIRANPGRGFPWAQSMYQALTKWAKEITDIINTGTQVQNIVPVVASAATINIVAYLSHISGSVAIQNIVVEDDFGGTICLICDAAFTLITGGNIARAGAPGVNQAVYLSYDHNAGLWFPSL